MIRTKLAQGLSKKKSNREIIENENKNVNIHSSSDCHRNWHLQYSREEDCLAEKEKEHQVVPFKSTSNLHRLLNNRCSLGLPGLFNVF